MSYEVAKLKHKHNTRKPQIKLILVEYRLLSGCTVLINEILSFR